MSETGRGCGRRSCSRVNQLAESLGITPRAIRFYEAKGLLAPRRVGTHAGLRPGATGRGCC